MLKYYIKTLGKSVPISSREYENYIIEDAICDGQTKTIAMRVIRENRQEARETGENIFTLTFGAQVIVSKE